MRGSKDQPARIFSVAYFNVYIYIYLYIIVKIYVCVCVSDEISCSLGNLDLGLFGMGDAKRQ